MPGLGGDEESWVRKLGLRRVGENPRGPERRRWLRSAEVGPPWTYRRSESFDNRQSLSQEVEIVCNTTKLGGSQQVSEPPVSPHCSKTPAALAPGQRTPLPSQLVRPAVQQKPRQ